MSGTDDKPVGVETMSTPTTSNDLVKAVDKLLNEIGPKFTKVSAEIFAKSKPILFHSDYKQFIARC